MTLKRGTCALLSVCPPSPGARTTGGQEGSVIAEAAIGSIHKDGPFWRDDNGAFFESGACNLMISGPAVIVEGTFEDALKKVKEDFGL